MLSQVLTSPCPGPNCKRLVGPGRVACSKHWFMVSEPTRLRVWRAYRTRPGSPEHYAAIAQAVEEMNDHA